MVQALLQQLNDEDPTVQWRAAEALGNLGIASEPVIQALLQQLDDENSIVQLLAAEAVGKLGKTNDLIQPIIQWIEHHQDSQAVGNMINALSTIVEG